MTTLTPHHPLRLADFDYNLPLERIAQTPLAERDLSRLLRLGKDDGRISHHRFADLPQFLEAGDILVLNDTRVTAMRLFGARRGHAGERVEVFLTHALGNNQWQGLVRPGKKLLPGVHVEFEGGLTAEVLARTDNRGSRLLQLSATEGNVSELLAASGNAPLPPYITTPLAPADRERYQTVYSAHGGSAAAPTAGLHFTEALLEKIAAMGIQVARVTLHVGLGTFRPIETENITEHVMHGEHITVTLEAAEMINSATGRVIAVGTTSARTLESAADSTGRVQPIDSETHLYITPGYQFKAVDALITNFHMPRSTLLVLVSALAGQQPIQRAYAEALRESYRFLSFGDAMFIV